MDNNNMISLKTFFFGPNIHFYNIESPVLQFGTTYFVQTALKNRLVFKLNALCICKSMNTD